MNVSGKQQPAQDIVHFVVILSPLIVWFRDTIDAKIAYLKTFQDSSFWHKGFWFIDYVTFYNIKAKKSST